ncbi:MAG: hypothetical protein GDA46_03640 [Bdellovibrionales bacterium]|nr:hypothetical protein [Bdellovibrionales bacterium]
MGSQKDVVILAKSRKNKGYCIAGKEVGKYPWIRPVREKGELSKEDQIFSSYPQLLDIVSIPFKKPISNDNYRYQTENFLIDDSIKWKKIGEENWDNLDKIKDEPDKLWNIDSSSNRGTKNRIALNEAGQLKNSLLDFYSILVCL